MSAENQSYIYITYKFELVVVVLGSPPTPSKSSSPMQDPLDPLWFVKNNNHKQTVTSNAIVESRTPLDPLWFEKNTSIKQLQVML